MHTDLYKRDFIMLILLISLITWSLLGADQGLVELPIARNEIYSESFCNHTYPSDVTKQIIIRMPYRDQVAFTSTCKELHTFPISVGLLDLRISPQKHTWLNLICAGGSLAMLYPLFKIVDPYLPYITEIAKETIYTTISAAPLALGIPMGIACLVSIPRLYKKATAALEYINTHEQQVTEKRIAQLTTNYYSIAKNLRNGALIIGALDIDYYKKSQAQPLLKTARACGIPKISIQVHTPISSPKEYLKPCSFLAENKRLKNLEITVDDKADTFLSPISIDSFYEGMKRNSSLQTLKLTGVALTPRLLDTLFTHKTLEELILNGCNATKHYNFTALAQNTTLKKLTLLYFTNHHSSINDSIAPALLAFMQHNRALESFKLRTFSLSDAAIKQLKTNPCAPKELFVP
jgi:hypothetical protein